jgi:hypothetical protein
VPQVQCCTGCSYVDLADAAGTRWTEEDYTLEQVQQMMMEEELSKPSQRLNLELVANRGLPADMRAELPLHEV